MNKRIKLKYLKIALMAALLVPMVAGHAVAEGPFDGSKNLVCAITRVHECLPMGGCEEVDVEVVELAGFFLVNFKKKEISAIYPPDDEVSPIEHVESVNAATIVQGSESGRGWGIVVDQNSGKLSGSVFGKDVGFLAYGACMPK